MDTIQENATVKVHYTGKLTSGEVFDSSVERGQPLEFQMGKGQLIPGFEAGLMNMKVNEKKTLNIPADKAYGSHRADLVQQVDKANLPSEINPEVGMNLMSRTPDGREMPLVVTAVDEKSITVDGNHPLAGKDLIFEVEVVSIQ